MRCLIRFLTRGAAGAVETRERTFEGEVLTLGRATDQVLQLKDRGAALEHARIARRGGHSVLTALGQAAVLVNGSLAREALLAPGDAVQIGANQLRIVTPPAGFDLAFTFELDPAARADEASAQSVQLRVGDSLRGMRGWSWLLFVLVLALALLIPASGLVDAAWRDRLRATVLPADTAWTAGPLASVHHVVAQKCEACHAQPFVRVKDAACLACHGPQLRGHAPELIEAGPGLDRARCTDCHREHDGSAALVSRDDVICASCHADLAQVAGTDAAAGDASDFLADHPDFRVTMRLMTRPAGSTWREETVRVRPGEAGVVEDSGLVFEHDVHLDPGGIRGPEGDVVLDCGDCHRPEAGGGRMQPISMARDCIACHRLDFDPAEPERMVPHGDPAVVVETLVEYYSKRYLQGFPDPLARARPARDARRPGPPLGAAERAAALEQARLRASDAARDLFERRSCGLCHEVSRTDPRDVAAGWTVRPVRLTRAWLPEAHFDHARHDTGLTSCATCHAASDSGDAGDILMPSIESCRECHAGSAGARARPNTVASGCMSCHDFHRETQPLWREARNRPPPGGAPP
jgi:predicted CXXCH cytochrome family protein